MDTIDNTIKEAEELITETQSSVRNLRERFPYMFDVPIDSIAESEFVSDEENLMLASEPVLRREWDTPEEDEAWKDL